MSPTESTISFSHLGRALFRHKGKMALFSLAVLVLTAAGTALAPRTYRSQAKLFLRLGRENATLDPTATFGQGPVVVVPNPREREIGPALEIPLTRDPPKKGVVAVGPDAILGRGPLAPAAGPSPAVGQRDEEITDRYRAVQKLGKTIKVEAVRKSNVVVITYDGPSPEVCQAVVSRLV